MKKRLFQKRGHGRPARVSRELHPHYLHFRVIPRMSQFKIFLFFSDPLSYETPLLPPHHNLPCVAARLAMRRAWKALRMSLSMVAFLRNEGRPRALM